MNSSEVMVRVGWMALGFMGVTLFLAMIKTVPVSTGKCMLFANIAYENEKILEAYCQGYEDGANGKKIISQ